MLLNSDITGYKYIIPDVAEGPPDAHVTDVETYEMEKSKTN